MLNEQILRLISDQGLITELQCKLISITSSSCDWSEGRSKVDQYVVRVWSLAKDMAVSVSKLKKQPFAWKCVKSDLW